MSNADMPDTLGAIPANRIPSEPVRHSAAAEALIAAYRKRAEKAESELVHLKCAGGQSVFTPSLRDWIAGTTLPALVTKFHDDHSADDLTVLAYQYADSMLGARAARSTT